MKNLLKNWKIKTLLNLPVVEGLIYNDELDRFPDGTLITTSYIVSTDFKNKKIQTKNTLYNLE